MQARQYYGKFGTQKPPQTAESPPDAFQKVPKAFPYLNYTHNRTGGNRRVICHGDLSRGDPGCFYGIQQPNGSGYCFNEGDVFEQRNENGSMIGTKGPSFSYGNAARSSSDDGVCSSLAHESVTHSRKGNAGDPAASGQPGRGCDKKSCDAATMQVGGGDGGYCGGGNFAVASREFTCKAAGNMTLGAVGTGSISSEANFSMGSETGCCSLGGKGVTISAADMVTVGAKATMSLYAPTTHIYASGKVLINCGPGPTNGDNLLINGQKGTEAVASIPVSSSTR